MGEQPPLVRSDDVETSKAKRASPQKELQAISGAFKSDDAQANATVESKLIGVSGGGGGGGGAGGWSH